MIIFRLTVDFHHIWLIEKKMPLNNLDKKDVKSKNNSLLVMNEEEELEEDHLKMITIMVITIQMRITK
ncbi:21161_t:CDS:2 [Cetraspora pellucida]|uniref:21161_t:CDS:1 n=1 Tax=Cetraspora pellucida TaxID=1433469 RepID=A0A9N9CQ19_9GLOM|nr:21161_t:CDS:2 [Cetraspora pellucida]